ncbi:hypothetical protein BCD48_40040 [Pseudofrankia sp. BMG5.36]|nr:hypothetical protein BCD48_40040 [Pseudofrankia sp. BMG5.36]
MRSSGEIRSYLADQMNAALRRPGMYGGEIALRLLFATLAHVERLDARWEAELDLLRARGLFTSTGVTGALDGVLPDGRSQDGAIASVYAEIAARFGWLVPDRGLSAAEQSALVQQAADWAGDDRTLGEVLSTWGAPSVWLGGKNPLYPKTLAYLVDDPQAPLVCFHLWNQIEPREGPGLNPVFPEPMMLAVRLGHGPLSTTLTFTPEGQRRRP